MKHLKSYGLIVCLVLCALLGMSKANAQIVPQDSLLRADSLRIQDSLARMAVFDSLDNALKSSEIILYPDKGKDFVVKSIRKVLKAGKHEVTFGLQQVSYPDAYANQYGQPKASRPIWVLFVVLFLFLMLGVLRIIFPVELRTIVDAYYKERLLLQVSKEDSLATSWPYIFLYGVFSLSLGLFVVVIVSSFGDKNYLTFENFLKNSGFVAILFIAKILLIRFVSFVFQLEKIVREYIAILYLVYFNSMFFLMPFLLLVVFVPTKYFATISIIYVCLVIILFAYRFLRTALHLFGNFKFSIFYLILYLCSLELAPILILVRALSN